MTTEIEKTFFDTFDIQYEFCSDICLNPCKFQCDDCKFRTERYPQISNRILLELICIISNYCQTKLQCDYQLNSVNIDELRQEVLRDCIEYCCKPIDIECIKHQVRTLFEEG